MNQANKKIKAIIHLLFLNVFVFAQNSAIFKGGSADGWANGSYQQASVNIFKGGSGDGWASSYRPVNKMGTASPVTTVQKQGSNATLVQIKTGGINDLQYAEVERSDDTIHFQTIGKLTIAGGLSENRNYTFTDYQPLGGTNYYRVKQVTVNGITTYTPFNLIKFERDEIRSTIKCYPNPTNGIVNIALVKEIQQVPVVITILNATGMLMEQIKYASGAATILQVNLARFAKGTYFMRIQTNAIDNTQRIVLQ